LVQENIDTQIHPEYSNEAGHLHQTINAIQEFIRRVTSTDISGGDAWAKTSLVKHNAERIGRYEDAQNEPYFARVDFAIDGQEANKYYIGYQSLDLKTWEVIDWRAPASKLFYGSNAALQTYPSPEGIVSAELFLKRHFTIEQGELLDIADSMDRRPDPKSTGSKMISAEAYLIQFLYSRGDPKLQDIVKTIQEQQDRIIRAPAQITMIINGVAGSGKTSIAFHRIAYLLYPDTTKGDFHANRIIVFAPNRLFLSYVSDLLPHLGINNVKQVTFDDWALEKMQFANLRDGKYQRKYRIQETALRVFLSNDASREEQRQHWQRARLKGGGKIQKLLDNYIVERKQNFPIPPNGLAYPDLGPLKVTLGLTNSEIKQIFTAVTVKNMVYYALHEEVIARLEQALTNKYEQAVNTEYEKRLQKVNTMLLKADQAQDSALKIRAQEMLTNVRSLRNRALSVSSNQRQVVAAVKSLLRADLERMWPAIDLRNDFYCLLSDQKLLNKLGSNFLNVTFVQIAPKAL